MENINQPIAIKDVLADVNHPLNKEVSEMMSKLESGEISMCGCMGPIGDDPYCPCQMRSRGLEPTNLWTPEKIAELDMALAKAFNFKQK